MTAQSLLTSLLRHKASADDELLDALGLLDGEGAAPAFRSAMRVLNHASIVDRIFVANLQGHAHGYDANWTREAPPLVELSADIRATDNWLVDYIARASAEALEEVVGFTFTDGAPGRMSRGEMLAHVITHSGYHRGEVGRLLPEIEATAMRDVFAGWLHRAEPARRRV